MSKTPKQYSSRDPRLCAICGKKFYPESLIPPKDASPCFYCGHQIMDEPEAKTTLVERILTDQVKQLIEENRKLQIAAQAASPVARVTVEENGQVTFNFCRAVQDLPAGQHNLYTEPHKEK